MSENQKAARSAKIISLATIVSRVLGFVRDMLLAGLFGATLFADAFFVAFKIPNLMRRLFGEGALNSSYIPVFMDTLAIDREQALRSTANLFNLLAVVLAIVSALGVIFSSQIVSLMTFTFGDAADPVKFDLTVRMTRIMFPYLFFICLAALGMGFLNSMRHFLIPALSPVMLNIAMIVFLAAIAPTFGSGDDTMHLKTVGLAWSVVVGGALQLAMHFPAMHCHGFRLRGLFDFTDPFVRKVMFLMGPAVFGLAVTQLNILIDTLLAWLLGDGAVSALYYSNRLVQLPLAIFGIAVATAFLPTFSALVAGGKTAELPQSMSYALRTVMFITFPATAGLMAAGTPIVRLLFERGQFTAMATEWTVQALICYAIGLFFFSAVNIAVKIFYSLHDSRFPVKAGIVAMILNIVLNLILMRYMRHAGLALATSIAAMVNLFLLLRVLRSRLGSIDGRRMARSCFKTLTASGFMAGVVYGMRMLFETAAGSAGEFVAKTGEPIAREIAQTAASVVQGVPLSVEVPLLLAGGVAVYILSTWMLKCEELWEVASILNLPWPTAGVR